jgi:hypothetical protein
MYYLGSEKPLRLAIFYGIGGTFSLAIRIFFTSSSSIGEGLNYKIKCKIQVIKKAAAPDITSGPAAFKIDMLSIA